MLLENMGEEKIVEYSTIQQKFNKKNKVYATIVAEFVDNAEYTIILILKTIKV